MRGPALTERIDGVRANIAANAVSRRELLALAAIVLAFVVAVARQIAYGAPMDYDETVYAMKGRAWLEDFPTSGWAPYRGPALPVVAWIIGHFSFDETPYQVVGLIAGVGLLLAVWALGRRAFSPAAGLIAAAAVAAGAELQIQSAQFLTDVPTAALMTVMALVLWRALERAGPPGRAVLLIAPIAFAVYSLRYGAAPVIVIELLAAGAIWWRTWRAAPRLALATVAAIGTVAIPHLVYAIRTFGTPWGALTYTLDLAHKDEATNGLGSYVEWLPSVIVGRVGGTLAVIGVVATVATLVRAARRREWTSHARAVSLVGAVAIVDVIVLGVAAPSQPRYVFFAGAMLALVGADAVVRAWRAVTPGRAPRAVTPVGVRRAGPALACVVLALGFVLGTKLAFHRWDRILDHRVPVKNVALAIKARADRQPCGVLSTAMPQITWYSGCYTVTFDEPPVAGRERFLPDGPRFLVLIDGVRAEPTGSLRDTYLSLTDRVVIFQEKGDHLVTVYRMVPERT